MKRFIDRCYERVNRSAEGSPSGAVTDLWQVFAERGIRLLRSDGRVGWVLPSAFHANQSATGIRELYLTEAALECCYSFENRRKLFEIDSRFKYANVVARRDRAGTKELLAAFYLHDDEWLHSDRADRPPLRYKVEFVRQTGGNYFTFLELRAGRDLEVAEHCFRGELFGQVCERLGLRFGEECHMSKDAWRFTPTEKVLKNGEDPRDPDVARDLLRQGYLMLHEGKTFWHYEDHWEDRPRYLAEIRALRDKADVLKLVCYYRLAFRAIASSTNERTGVFAFLPFTVFGNSAPNERHPANRPNARVLLLMGGLNSFSFDWTLRQRSSANVNLFIVAGCPVSALKPVERFLAHSSVRLTCNHSGYAPLWREQLGDTWREPKPPLTWPVLATDDERWQVRAAIDAVVADAYGLNREQYAHVLSTFSHKSYPKAPVLCLEKFDELKQIGLDAFTKKYDPYWDIPLNESLPKPVIELPIPAETDESGDSKGLFDGEKKPKSADKKKPGKRARK